MKKIFLGLSLAVGTWVSAQYYPQDGYSNHYPQYGSYQDNNFYFPDEYYYEYPEDYYEDGYYENLYNDYNHSIRNVNWNSFFREFGLSRPQISLIIDLNRQFPSFHSWNSYYRMNPRRWWYDRFYALERILGPKIFIVFQNRYYNGYSPVAYYDNYWYDYYRPRYTCRPHYANININFFRVDRNVYHRHVGSNYGWNQPRDNSYRGSFRDGNNQGFRTGTNDNGFGIQNRNSARNNTGFRNSNDGNTVRNGGLRPGNSDAYATPRSVPRNNGGLRPNVSTEPVYSSPRSTPRASSSRPGTRPENIYSAPAPRTSPRNDSGLRGGSRGSSIQNQSRPQAQPRMQAPSRNVERSSSAGSRGFRLTGN